MSRRLCGLCGEELKSTQALKKHISQIHKIEFDYYVKNFHFGKVVGCCEECGAATTFSIRNYSKYCSTTCQLKVRYRNETEEEKEIRKLKISEGWTLEKKEKQSKTHIEINKNYDEDYYSNRHQKASQTKLEVYGDINHGGFGSDRYKEVMTEKYGVDNIRKLDNYYELYCGDVVEKVRKTCLEKYNQNWIFRENFDNNMEKRKKYCLEKYGVEHYVQSDEYKAKVNDIVGKIRTTKKSNGTINTSKLETDIFEELKILYPDYNILRNYKDERYPYSCDFYIKELDLFIEVQGYFTHGKKSFENSIKDRELLYKWGIKASTSTFMKNAINIWTVKDVEKRNVALKNGLKFLELFSFINIKKQIDRVLNGIDSNSSIEDMNKEILSIKNNNGDINRRPNTNKIIKHYQGKTLFKHENTLYINNPVIRRKLIQNRIEFLNKNEHELSDRELLSGFKISGIHRGFSFFSPFWFKFFIEKYNVKRVFDPFGGWGHRLLGTLGTSLETYIYNDVDKDVKDAVENIYQDFRGHFKDFYFYNYDFNNFELKEDIDSIFMCPPYDDVEKYSHKNDDFDGLMKKVCELYVDKAQILGVIIREDFYNIISKYIGECSSSFEVNQGVDHFKTKNKKEKLYIWQK